MPLSEQQIEKMKRKRKSIMEAATYLFATEGYEGTTIKKVSASAGISFGSVFTYFKDKEELFHTVVVEPLEDFSNQVLEFDEAAEEPLVELEKMIKHHMSIFSGMNHYLQLVVQVIGQHERFLDTFESLDQFHNQFRGKVSRLIENGQQKGLLIKQDPLIVATLYTSLLIGMRLNSTDRRYSDIWEEFALATIAIFGPIR
ncbi:TetR/AcrR family transcriptional regulator [Alkalihalobacillus pseudalcaliphilus]|uniref:TetR/AcrR family transcriptional regulator n=1 Tax=Alkalihalobacillus pseudalcaliphilus TaxID=79884 RepID=UPI00064DA415|nr:TetR/AcrR family transcriptional regulator [Alkalihalobacillus pseudalcaliphilus]KMK77987.1 transcriptional regulator [Alkalihalobacillus pseudalcaliphilus]